MEQRRKAPVVNDPTVMSHDHITCELTGRRYGGLERRRLKHFHMLFLDGVYIEHADGSLRFRWVKAPTSAELARLTQALALRIGRYLERQGLLERDAENSYLAGDVLETGPMEQFLGP